MVSVQDHKRARDDDQGPNTGGMGTVSPSTNLSVEMHKQIMHDIVLPTIGGLAAEGRKYQGVLYVGLMITEAGPKVLEFNARFGDPETQVIMARMRSDIVPILKGVAEGAPQGTQDRVGQGARGVRRPRRQGLSRRRGDGQGGPAASTRCRARSDIVVYHAATALRDGKVVTVGGRVLGVTALGANLDAAVPRAYEAVAKVSFDGMHYRRDIGRRRWRACTAPSRPEAAPG